MSQLTPALLERSTGGRWLASCVGVETLAGVGIDTRDDQSGRAFFAIRGERFDGHDFVPAAIEAGAIVVVVDRDIDVEALPSGVGALKVADTIAALGQFAAAYRDALTDTIVIAVTGSVGKTTTKRLIHAVLGQAMQGHSAPKSFNNNIGVPLTLLGIAPGDRFVVVEVGTNAPGEIDDLARLVRPDIAVIISIGHCHLEGFGSIEAIAAEKVALLNHLTPGGVAIINADAPLLVARLGESYRRVTFGESANAGIRLVDRSFTSGRHTIDLADGLQLRLGLPGRHNAINALAAVAVAREVGVSDAAVARGLASVEPDAMRMTLVQTEHLTIYNDAYNANPDSMRAALNTFAELTPNVSRRVAILGDMLELGEQGPGLHRDIAHHIIQGESSIGLDHVITIGPLAAHLADQLALSWPEDRLTALKAMDDWTAARIYARLLPGDAILLKASRGMALERLIDDLRGQEEAAAVANTPC